MVWSECKQIFSKWKGIPREDQPDGSLTNSERDKKLKISRQWMIKVLRVFFPIMFLNRTQKRLLKYSGF